MRAAEGSGLHTAEHAPAVGFAAWRGMPAGPTAALFLFPKKMKDLAPQDSKQLLRLVQERSWLQLQ